MADLNDILDSMGNNGGASAPTVVPDLQQQQKLKLKQQMTGLASTQTGIDVLQRILNNTSVDVVERTAAAEVLNPGTVVNFNPDGTTSFSSPQANSMFRPSATHSNSAGEQEAFRVEQQTSVAKRIATVPELMAQVNSGLQQVQAETDPTVIVTGLANLNQSIADFQYARTTALRQESRRMFGVDAFEQQMQTDRQLDMEESRQYFNVEYMGMSQASQATLAQFQQASAKADEWYNTQLKTDPALAAIGTKAKYLEDFAGARLKTLGEQTDIAQMATLVDPAAIDATLIAIGKDPSKATTEERQQVSMQIQSNNTYYTKAQELGLREAQIPLFLSTGGSDAQMARNILMYRSNGNEAFVNEITSAYEHFEQFAQMSPEQLEAKGLVVSAKPSVDELAFGGNSAKDRMAKQNAVSLARWEFIRSAYNRQATNQMHAMEGMDDPQSPLLKDFTSVRDGLRDYYAKTNSTEVATLGMVVQRMSWPTDTVQAKRQEEALIDYLQTQAQKKGNSIIRVPEEFGNRNLIASFVQTNRINSMKANHGMIDWLTSGIVSPLLGTAANSVALGFGLTTDVLKARANKKD